MGQSHVLDGKMTLEQAGKLLGMQHRLVDLINLPYGKKGKLNYDRVVKGLQDLMEVQGRFQGWQRDSFEVEIELYNNPLEHLAILERIGGPLGGLYCKEAPQLYCAGPGNFIPAYVSRDRLHKPAFDCIVVTPEEMGFQKKRIPFNEVVERGQMDCGLFCVDPRYIPQALVAALKHTRVDSSDSLLAAEGDNQVFGIRGDEPSDRYKYMLSVKPNPDFAVDRDQQILWRIAHQ